MIPRNTMPRRTCMGSCPAARRAESSSTPPGSADDIHIAERAVGQAGKQVVEANDRVLTLTHALAKTVELAAAGMAGEKDVLTARLNVSAACLSMVATTSVYNATSVALATLQGQPIVGPLTMELLNQTEGLAHARDQHEQACELVKLVAHQVSVHAASKDDLTAARQIQARAELDQATQRAYFSLVNVQLSNAQRSSPEAAASFRPPWPWERKFGVEKT